MLYMLGPDELRAHAAPGRRADEGRRARRAPRRSGCAPRPSRESMDVCFITQGGREAFLGARIARRPGAIVDERRARPSARTTASTRSPSGSGADSASRSANAATSTDIAAGDRRPSPSDRATTCCASTSISTCATCGATRVPPDGSVARAMARAHGDRRAGTTRGRPVVVRRAAAAASRPARSSRATTATCVAAEASSPGEQSSGSERRVRSRMRRRVGGDERTRPRSTGATRTASRTDVEPPVRPRRRPNVDGLAQQDRDAASVTEPQVERDSARRGPRLGRMRRCDLLPAARARVR